MPFARMVWAAATCASLAAAPVSADQTVAPIPVRPPAIVRLGSPWLATLRRIAATGDGARLAAAVFELLADLQRARIGDGCCDPSRDYFFVTFVGADAGGAPAIVTVLAHEPSPASAELPGIHGSSRPVYQLFLADDLASSLQATYAISHQENPSEKVSGDFVAAVIGRLALPSALRADAPATPSHTAQPSDMVVAFDRLVLPETGKITLRQTVTYAPPIAHLESRVESLSRDQLAVFDARDPSQAPRAACGALSTALESRVDAEIAGAACGLWPADLAACAKSIREAVADAASAYFAAAPACPIAAGAPLVEELLSAVEDVKPLTSTIVVGNAPQIRYGFGLAAAYITRIGVDGAHPRAQLQGGRIVSAPFPRELTMGVANLTPWGYDGQRQSPSFAERARLVAGIAFSPYFGVTGGAAFAINRYVAVNAGYARLWFDTPKPGELIGAAPTDGNKAAPFDLRSTGALFLGVSYNFK